MKKLITVISTLFLLVSCGGNNPSQSTSTSQNPSISTSTSTSKGEHDTSVNPLEGYLLKDAKTDYRLVVPEDPSTELIYTREEFIKLFKEATGCTISAIGDTGLSHTANNKFISIGDTTLLKTSGLNIDKTALKEDGFVINTKDNSIFIVGGGDTGSLYGTYKFLNYHFNFETYTRDTYYIDSDVHEIRLMDYKIKENPDIDKRSRIALTNPSTTNYDDKMFAYRLGRLDNTFSEVYPIHKTSDKGSAADNVHNSYYFFEDEFRASYPKSISDNQSQICFTAHGDKTTYDAMVEHAKEKVINSMKWYGNKYCAVQLGVNDYTEMCKCEYCCAHEDKYLFNGTRAPAATLISFIIDLAEVVYDWMELPENKDYKQDIWYTFLAYQSSLIPPIKVNADGTYSAYEDLKPQGKYANIRISPMVAMSSFKPAFSYYAVENEATRSHVEGWASVYRGCQGWSYGTFFNDFLCFYDATSFYQDFYKELYRLGFTYLYEQIHSDQRGGDSGFNQLYTYLYSKLAWDSSLDINVLTDNFFKNVYDVASSQMRDIYEQCRLWFRTTVKTKVSNNGEKITESTTIFNQDNVGFVTSLMSKFDEAYRAISIYENNPTIYNVLKNNIDQEWLFPAKILVSCYRSYFTHEEVVNIYNKFKNIIETNSLKNVGEFVSINTFIATIDQKIKEEA